MTPISTSKRDIMARLGFDVLAHHLEAMRDKGVRSINIDDATQASSAALRTWEDANYPYRLPDDLRAFLLACDGFCLSWATQHVGGSVAEGPGCVGGREGVVGRIRIDRLSAIKRLQLDLDDFRGIASSRASSAAAAAAASPAFGDVKSSLPLRSSPAAFPGANSGSGDGLKIPGNKNETAKPNSSEVRMGSSDDAESNGGYGVAAFSLDSLCEVGRVALVYGGGGGAGGGGGGGGGGAPALKGGTTSSSSSVRAQHHPNSLGKPTTSSAMELVSPEVWFQDLSCRWHFLAESFTSYFRMVVVHLGILGWQQAFSPVGLSPSTQQCMRLYCPDRLLFDQLEWQKETASRNVAKKAAVH